jgi:hypothetical protein
MCICNTWADLYATCHTYPFDFLHDYVSSITCYYIIHTCKPCIYIALISYVSMTAKLYNLMCILYMNDCIRFLAYMQDVHVAY